MHEKAHGLIPNEIIEVNTTVVNSFLGRITDPETADEITIPNLKVFNDSAFRILLVTKTTFDTGFSSPSYFTKCFQKRFVLQPIAYLKVKA